MAAGALTSDGHYVNTREKEVYTMCTHPAAFHQGVAQLRLESPGSVDRRLGVLLDMLDQSGDEDAIERLLFEMVTEDPAGSVEYRIAGHLIALLFPAEAKR